MKAVNYFNFLLLYPNYNEYILKLAKELKQKALKRYNQLFVSRFIFKESNFLFKFFYFKVDRK